MAEGTGRAVLCDRHPDRVAEACRWQVCEGELVQAIGRGRGVNRTASNPLEMDILANVDLPVTVAKVASWDSEDISDFVEMLAEGIILTSPADMAKCWPELWSTPKAAEHDIARSAGFPHFPYKRYSNKSFGGKSPLPPGLYLVPTARPAAASKPGAPPSTR